MKKFTFYINSAKLRLIGQASPPTEPRIIQSNIKAIKKELETLNNNLNFITDPVLLDQMIFQIKAAEVRYQYWYKLGREYTAAQPVNSEQE